MSRILMLKYNTLQIEIAQNFKPFSFKNLFSYIFCEKLVKTYAKCRSIKELRK